MKRIPTLLALAALWSQPAPAAGQPAPAMDAAKILDAQRAAPAELAESATILDWPSSPEGDFRVIRAGSNGWSCLPDYPGDAYDEPHCVDDEWLDYMRAFLAGRPPTTRRLGLAYMLDSRWEGSNIDPAATAPEPGNQWHRGGSHLMVIVPDPSLLEWFSTEPTPEGEAYVMWPGTPFAHLMIPIPESRTGGAR